VSVQDSVSDSPIFLPLGHRAYRTRRPVPAS
jgi:hypothetical protein